MTIEDRVTVQFAGKSGDGDILYTMFLDGEFFAEELDMEELQRYVEMLKAGA